MVAHGNDEPLDIAAAVPASGHPITTAMEGKQHADQVSDNPRHTGSSAAFAPSGGCQRASMQREAAYNLSLIYQASGADDLAREVLRLHLQI